MQQDTVSIPKLILIASVYAVLSVLGFFTQIEAVLFPVFALPFALYVAKNKPPAAVQVSFHLVMLIINYFASDNGITAVLIYSVSVVIITYIILFFHKQQLALPNFIMYVAISLCVIVFVFFMFMKMRGIDVEQLYFSLLDDMKVLFDESVKALISVQETYGTVKKEYLVSLNESQQYVTEALEQMKAYYAYVIVTLVVSASALTVIIFNAVLRRKDKALPSIKELIEFRLSKAAVLIFIISMIVVSMTDSSQTAIVVLGLNLMNVFVWLFRIAGGLGLIGLLSHSAASDMVKILGYIGIILSFGAFPFMYILIIFGCLDAFFNFRKVEIVV